MKQRIVSGIVIMVLIVAAGVAGGDILAAAMLCISMVGYRELMRACGVIGPESRSNAVTGVAELMIAVYYIGLIVEAHRFPGQPEAVVHGSDYLSIAVIVITFLLTGIVYVLTYPKYSSKTVAYSLFGFIYAPVLLSFVYRARLLPSGIFVYALIFVCASISDVCALAAGMLFGRHKLAPVLSPKKTVEGAIGGVAGAALVSFLIGCVIMALNPQEDLRLAFTVLGGVGALLGMAGDLAASAIKREYGIKDYGNLIPGHGGIMDRFDSIIFTAPVMYILGTLVLGIA